MVEDLECCTELADHPESHIGRVLSLDRLACDRHMDRHVRPPRLTLV